MTLDTAALRALLAAATQSREAWESNKNLATRFAAGNDQRALELAAVSALPQPGPIYQLTTLGDIVLKQRDSLANWQTQLAKEVT